MNTTVHTTSPMNAPMNASTKALINTRRLTASLLAAAALGATGAARADVHLQPDTAPALKAGATAADVRATWGRPAREMRFAASGLGLMRYDVPGGQSVVEVDLDTAGRVTAVRVVSSMLP